MEIDSKVQLHSLQSQLTDSMITFPKLITNHLAIFNAQIMLKKLKATENKN